MVKMAVRPCTNFTVMPEYDSASPSLRKLFNCGYRFKAHPLHETISPVNPPGDEDKVVWGMVVRVEGRFGFDALVVTAKPLTTRTPIEQDKTNSRHHRATVNGWV